MPLNKINISVKEIIARDGNCFENPKALSINLMRNEVIFPFAITLSSIGITKNILIGKPEESNAFPVLFNR